MSPDQEVDAVLRIARKAAKLVRSIYDTPFTVELKAPGDPVTRADREANELICAELSAAFPDAAVVAEESAPTDKEALAALVSKDRVFYVDPLDGTREFADRNGEFAVMIGLAVGGRAKLGVVVMPTTGEAFVGTVGKDRIAFVENESGARMPLRVTSEADPAQATIVVSRSHPAQVVQRLHQSLAFRKVTPCGSVGVKVSRVATATADLYVHGGGGAKRWDTCGPEAVLVGAGGRFTDLSGSPIDYSATDLVLRNGLIASNGALHDRIVSAVALL